MEKRIIISWKPTPANTQLHADLKKLAIDLKVKGGVGEITSRVMQEFLDSGKKKSSVTP